MATLALAGPIAPCSSHLAIRAFSRSTISGADLLSPDPTTSVRATDEERLNGFPSSVRYGRSDALAASTSWSRRAWSNFLVGILASLLPGARCLQALAVQGITGTIGAVHRSRELPLGTS
jgi:hypothetical protein